MVSNGVSHGLAGQISIPANTFSTARAFLWLREVWVSVPDGEPRRQMAEPCLRAGDRHQLAVLSMQDMRK